MMKVSRGSWHYKLWKLTHPNPADEPKNLCRYFWRCVLTVVIPLGLGGLALMGVGAIALLVFKNAAISGFIVSGVCLAAFIIFAIYKLICWRGAWLWDVICNGFIYGGKGFATGVTAPYKGVRYTAKKKRPSLFIAYLKAKKQKACPMIEVVD